MDIAQYFDTTVTDCESGLAVRVILIPNASLAPHARDGLLTAAQVLGLRITARLQSETEVVAVMSSLLSTSNPEARELAQAVATEPRLPFGEAGPQLVSLMAIARSAGDDLARTTSLVSMVDWRLLLVDAPAGKHLRGARPRHGRTHPRSDGTRWPPVPFNRPGGRQQLARGTPVGVFSKGRLDHFTGVEEGSLHSPLCEGKQLRQVAIQPARVELHVQYHPAGVPFEGGEGDEAFAFAAARIRPAGTTRRDEAGRRRHGAETPATPDPPPGGSSFD